MAESMRLQKWLAQAGLCSRREGERWIAMGRVAINGQIVTQPGCLVGDLDRVMVDGKTIAGKGKRSNVVLAFHKPPDVVCTRHDPEERRTIYHYLENVPERLLYVGRLDINSEGLIVLTNDGNLVHRLTHPSAQVPRCYRVRVHGRINDTTLHNLQKGVLLEDGHTGPLEVAIDRNTSANNWLTMTLHEGRNRIIRRIFETLDMKVSRLIRISFGPISLGELPRGHWRFLSTSEQKQLRQSAEGIHPPLPPPSQKNTPRHRP